MMKNIFRTTSFMVALILASSSMTVDAASCRDKRAKKGEKNQNQIVHVTNVSENVNANLNLNVNANLNLDIRVFVLDFTVGTPTDALFNANDKPGSVLPFSGKFYSLNDNRSIGQVNGHAILIGTQGSPEGRTFNCSWTSHFDGTSGIPHGAIMLAGDLKEYGVSSLAIIGGTGAFAKATGYAEVTAVYRDSAGNVLPNVDANNTEGVDFAKTTYEHTFFIR